MESKVKPNYASNMEWLNYHHLRYFWTVAKEGSLARAAEKLHVSQPSISEQMRALEAALGEKLFLRAGRKNVLSDAGQMVFGYADEIFSLGREMLNAVKQRPTSRSLRLSVGVADAFPKLVTSEILRKVFALPQDIHVVCREGKMEDLLGQLAAHRLDIVLADEPASSSVKFRAFNHPLGESGVMFCAAAKLANRLRPGFPKSLHGAPAFLPTENTSLRRTLENWFHEINVQPQVIGEFEDLALMKAVAADGRGFIAVPDVVTNEALGRYHYKKIGSTNKCRVPFHAITTERRIIHPAIAVMTGKLTN